MELCRRIRAGGHRVPVLLLTALDSLADKEIGFEAGADDYLVKPFAFKELLLRARALTKRYADQRWLIYDQRRHYGLYFDLTRTDIVQFENPAGAKSTDISATVLDEREPLFKLLWQSYFDHVNIPERKNMKLHRRHIPLRYWKYLSEKQPRELRFEPIQNKRPIAGKEISAGLRQLPE